MSVYEFSVTLIANIRIDAASKEQAIATIRESIDGADANLGCWPNGDPVVGSIAIEGELDLESVDGETV